MLVVIPGYRSKSRTQIFQNPIQYFHLRTCQTSKVRKLKYIQLYEKSSLKEMSRFPDSKRQHGGQEEENRTRKTLETPLLIRRSVVGKCVKYESVGDVP